ncbi:CCA tRNA nucleotidyltransferase [Patescibacteria group bacterium]
MEREERWLSPVKFPKPETFLSILQGMSLTHHVAAYRKVLEVCVMVRWAGGRAMLVGGSVRDFLAGKISKDFDVEVYGLEPETIREIVSQVGKFKDAGRSFGVLKIFLEGGMDIDVSLPRVDSKNDKGGHNGFNVRVNPYMSIKEAARRRDFTMNSICADPLTGELYDPFGGVVDIWRRVLRVTDSRQFRDDPLRVLRAIQFVARLKLEVDPCSILILQEMALLVSELPVERIGEEWRKLLLKPEKPSLGLRVGMELGIWKHIHPELPPLVETEQEPEWHPEGDAWEHTVLTVDEAAGIVRREGLEGDKAMEIMLGAFCHDFGKPETTEFVDGRIRSRGHEKAGEKPTRSFLKSLGVNRRKLEDPIVGLVVNHLYPTILFIEERVKGKRVRDKSIRRLADRAHPATIRNLVLVSEADHRGRGNFSPEVVVQMDMPIESFPVALWLLERAQILRVEMSRPESLTRGRDWMSFGFPQGSHIGELIRLSNYLRDGNCFTLEDVLVPMEGVASPDEAVERLRNLL